MASATLVIVHGAGPIGMLWFLSWTGATLALHFRLVAKLKELGIEVPWLLQNQPWVEWTYVEACRERQIDPWPAIRWIVGCWLASLPGFVVALLSIVR